MKKKMKKLLLFFLLTFLHVALCVEDESQIFLSALASALEQRNPIKLDAFEGEIDATYTPQVSNGLCHN